ncbi:MAG: F0F1 ATP synthase subunit B [Mycoplasmataceae bacterium]|nr:F0F1 ATP synthase subunit B [Mycoplasmataceae bacterium]
MNFPVLMQKLNELVANFFVVVPFTDNPGPTGAFEGLIPTVSVVIGTVISLSIVFAVVSYFIYFPVKKITEDRSSKIKNDLEEAEKMNSNASKSFKNAQDILVSAKTEATSIVATSISQADIVKNSIIDDASIRSKELIEAARNQITQEREQFAAELQKQIIDTSILAATKIVEKEIDSKANKKLITDLIKELEK